MSTHRHDEVAELQHRMQRLETENNKAILQMEAELNALPQMELSAEDWAEVQGVIDIITMEELPPLKDSIRKITVKSEDN